MADRESEIAAQKLNYTISSLYRAVEELEHVQDMGVQAKLDDHVLGPIRQALGCAQDALSRASAIRGY